MPLAHILLPQLMRRAKEIEAELGPVVPPRAGFLAQYRRNPAEERTGWRKEPDGVVVKEYNLDDRHVKPRMEPAAPVQAPGAPTPSDEVVGMTESGRPIYASDRFPAPPVQKGPRGGQILMIDPAKAGMTEAGEPLATRGTPAGYLKQPVVVVPGGELAARDALRGLVKDARGAKDGPDIFTAKEDDFTGKSRSKTFGKRGVEGRQVRSLMDRDVAAAQALKYLYGPAREAYEGNVDENGVELGYPAGYLEGLDPGKASRTKAGVAALRFLDKGQPI